jgi:GAF domain
VLARDFAPYLAEASEVLASSLDYEATLASLARLVVPALADWCAIDVLEEDGTIQQLAVVHEDPEKVAWARGLRRLYPPEPDAPRGMPRVLRSGKAEFYPEVTDETLVAAARDGRHLRLMRQVGFTSVMIVPLIARGRTLGPKRSSRRNRDGATSPETWRWPRTSPAARPWPWITPGSTGKPKGRSPDANAPRKN